jgi:hypothetical protein
VLPANGISGRQSRPDDLDGFKEFTARKLEDLRCPDHHQPPRLRFHGSTLRDVTIQISGCCGTLASMANARIAGRD